MIDRITSCTGKHCITDDPSSYRVIFFSSAPIGIPFLQKIKSDPRFDLIGVITMPSAKTGRGMRLQPNIIYQEAQHQGVKPEMIFTPRTLRRDAKKNKEDAEQTQQRLIDNKPDLLVVIAYGKIIPQDILDIPTIATINVHGSLLPKYRGASPIQSVFLNDEKQSGITIMKMDAGLDTGDILSMKKTPLYFNRTAIDLIEWMKDKGPIHLTNTMRDYAKGHIDTQQQDNSQVTRCGKIEKELGQINPFSDSLQHIYNIYRGCFLRPKTYFFLDSSRGTNQGKRIIIEQLILNGKTYHQHSTSTLFSKHKQSGKTIILNPAIITFTVKPEGSKKMSREDFLKGYPYQSIS